MTNKRNFLRLGQLALALSLGVIFFLNAGNNQKIIGYVDGVYKVGDNYYIRG
jgi:hypothetical protein